MKKKILILGVSGMLGNILFTLFSQNYKIFDTYGTLRDKNKIKFFNYQKKKLYFGYNVNNFEKFNILISKLKPDYVINCIGSIKQKKYTFKEYLNINSFFPNKLNILCIKYNAKLIHFSTDCVFNGKYGNRNEHDEPDARDTYGITKFLGEVYSSNSITLRTSIIGHELGSSYGLLEWFLKSKNKVVGYENVKFNGVTTTEIFNLLKKIILIKKDISGLYHISSNKISKKKLLDLIAKIYKKNIKIIPSKKIIIDRSLNSSLIKNKINYKPPSWEKMIVSMKNFYENNKRQ